MDFWRTYKKYFSDQQSSQYFRTLHTRKKLKSAIVFLVISVETGERQYSQQTTNIQYGCSLFTDIHHIVLIYLFSHPNIGQYKILFTKINNITYSFISTIKHVEISLRVKKYRFLPASLCLLSLCNTLGTAKYKNNTDLKIKMLLDN